MAMFKTRSADTLERPAADAAFAWPSDVIDEIDDDAFAEAIAAGRLLDPEHGVTIAA
jgi:hypothetical protein